MKHSWISTPEELEEMKTQGQMFKQGVWSNDETEQVKHNILKYCDVCCIPCVQPLGTTLFSKQNLLSNRNMAFKILVTSFLKLAKRKERIFTRKLHLG